MFGSHLFPVYPVFSQLHVLGPLQVPPFRHPTEQTGFVQVGPIHPVPVQLQNPGVEQIPPFAHPGSHTAI